ncbi:MAG: hypothetical protein ACE5EV_00240 [Gaiellales bacterium]
MQTPSPHDARAAHPGIRLARALVLAFLGLGLLTGTRFFLWAALAIAVPVVFAWVRAFGQRLD